MSIVQEELKTTDFVTRLLLAWTWQIRLCGSLVSSDMTWICCDVTALSSKIISQDDGCPSLMRQELLFTDCRTSVCDGKLLAGWLIQVSHILWKLICLRFGFYWVIWVWFTVCLKTTWRCLNLSFTWTFKCIFAQNDCGHNVDCLSLRHWP